MSLAIAPILVQGLFYGVAAGNIWSAPFIGGSSSVGLALMTLCMYFPARLQRANRFVRTAMVAAVAWPVAYVWQGIHSSEPGTVLALFQVAALLAGSQLGAALSLWREKQDDSGRPDEESL